MAIFEHLSFGLENVSQLRVWAVLLQLVWSNCTLNPAVQGDIALSLNIPYNAITIFEKIYLHL